MVLCQTDLRKAVADGRVVFSPSLQDDQWGPASVDLRLGFQFTKWKDGLDHLKVSVAKGLTLGGAVLWDTKELKRQDSFGEPETLPLKPGQFVLAMTYETVTVPNDLIALVEGRSTYARVGLSMHQTAPWIQPGWTGPIILEIRNSGALTIELTPFVDRPCQLTFFQLSGTLPDNLAYGANEADVYQGQRHPLDPKRER